MASFNFKTLLSLDTSSFSAGVKRAQASLNDLTSSFKQFSATLGAGLGLFRVISNIKDTAIELSTAEAVLKNVSRTSLEYAENQKYLADLASNYRQNILDLTTSWGQFEAAANSCNVSLQDQKKIFESLTRASAYYHMSGEQTKYMLLAITQMMSKGKIQAEELRRQLGNSLPGAFGYLAEAIGVSTAELEKMMKNGEVLAKDALPKLADKLNQITKDIDLSSLQLSLNELKNTWVEMVSKGDFSNTIAKIVDLLTSSLKFIANHIDGIKNTLIFIVGSSVLGKMAKYIRTFITDMKLANAQLAKQYAEELKINSAKVKQIAYEKGIAQARQQSNIDIARIVVKQAQLLGLSKAQRMELYKAIIAEKGVTMEKQKQLGLATAIKAVMGDWVSLAIGIAATLATMVGFDLFSSGDKMSGAEKVVEDYEKDMEDISKMTGEHAGEVAYLSTKWDETVTLFNQYKKLLEDTTVSPETKAQVMEEQKKVLGELIDYLQQMEDQWNGMNKAADGTPIINQNLQEAKKYLKVITDAKSTEEQRAEALKKFVEYASKFKAETTLSSNIETEETKLKQLQNKREEYIKKLHNLEQKYSQQELEALEAKLNRLKDSLAELNRTNKTVDGGDGIFVSTNGVAISATRDQITATEKAIQEWKDGKAEIQAVNRTLVDNQLAIEQANENLRNFRFPLTQEANKAQDIQDEYNNAKKDAKGLLDAKMSSEENYESALKQAAKKAAPQMVSVGLEHFDQKFIDEIRKYSTLSTNKSGGAHKKTNDELAVEELDRYFISLRGYESEFAKGLITQKQYDENIQKLNNDTYRQLLRIEDLDGAMDKLAKKASNQKYIDAFGTIKAGTLSSAELELQKFRKGVVELADKGEVLNWTQNDLKKETDNLAVSTLNAIVKLGSFEDILALLTQSGSEYLETFTELGETIKRVNAEAKKEIYDNIRKDHPDNKDTKYDDYDEAFTYRKTLGDVRRKEYEETKKYYNDLDKWVESAKKKNESLTGEYKEKLTAQIAEAEKALERMKKGLPDLKREAQIEEITQDLKDFNERALTSTYEGVKDLANAMDRLVSAVQSYEDIMNDANSSEWEKFMAFFNVITQVGDSIISTYKNIKDLSKVYEQIKEAKQSLDAVSAVEDTGEVAIISTIANLEQMRVQFEESVRDAIKEQNNQLLEQISLYQMLEFLKNKKSIYQVSNSSSQGIDGTELLDPAVVVGNEDKSWINKIQDRLLSRGGKSTKRANNDIKDTANTVKELNEALDATEQKSGLFEKIGEWFKGLFGKKNTATEEIAAETSAIALNTVAKETNTQATELGTIANEAKATSSKGVAVANTIEAGSDLVAAAAAKADAAAQGSDAAATVAKVTAGNIIAGIATAAAVASAVAGIVAVLKSAGAFANGGIVGGSSMSGDKLTARVNSGEMILNKQQQSTLWGVVNGKGAKTGGDVNFKIRGSELVGVLNNYQNKIKG